MYDLHTHTVLTDGEMLPAELVRRLAALGYTEVGIADHADATNLEGLVAAVRRLVPAAREYGVTLYPGVELTHVPPAMIPAMAREAKRLGAAIVVVHGETTAEPVAPGTNRAACACRDVDVLAHPGFLTAEEAALARENGVAVELTARCGHNRTNGHVARVALEAGCTLVIDSDAHAPGDLMDARARRVVGMGAGLTPAQCESILSFHIGEFLAVKK
ncbi:MAG: histidinol phosphate phosphatase domain-containing protein [Methanolinea sp.]|nr:histidinol phosphate phosphatase domain-containing protein [Methanolinea sp.]